jgi:hypothetical protein
MTYGVFARILLRYVGGLIVGMEMADWMAGDPDLVLFVGVALAAGVEIAYGLAKRRGWAT